MTEKPKPPEGGIRSVEQGRRLLSDCADWHEAEAKRIREECLPHWISDDHFWCYARSGAWRDGGFKIELDIDT